MTLIELQRCCAEWDRSTTGFTEVVAGSAALGLYQRELAAEFEVAESTVSRWARGLARPHPRMQRLIVEAIGKRATAALKAAGTVVRSSPVAIAARSRSAS